MLDSPLLAALLLGGFGLIFELVGALFQLKVARRLCYLGSMVLTAFAATLLFLVSPGVGATLIGLVATFRIINTVRVLSGRMHERHAYLVTRRSTFVLAGLQVGAVSVWLGSQTLEIKAWTWLWALILSAFVVALLLLISTLINLKKTSLRVTDKYTSNAELPTVSVCLPARNETALLPECLESILASDYPKLEVLVLDDCSQDKTSEIIRSLAQRGVRFIKGESPRKGWLAKNQAYQALSEAANGEVLLFCGVDVRFDKSSIRQLVGTLVARKKQMISVMPEGKQDNEDAGLVQPMRYWWELVLPRRLFNRPPALSTLWLIQRQALQTAGGFKALSNTVLPEAYLAREIARTSDGYTFMRSGGNLKVASVKPLSDQIDTALRMRYPQLRKRPEAVLLLTLTELWLLAVPAAVFIFGFFVNLGLIWTLAGLIQILLGYIHYRILKVWNVGQYSLLLTALPLAFATEIFLTFVSMWRYEFGTVEWKERNICIPVMHVISHLPKV